MAIVSELQATSREQLPVDTKEVDVEDSKQNEDVEELGAVEVADMLSSTVTSHEEWMTTRKELWSFYLYYVVSLFALDLFLATARVALTIFSHVFCGGKERNNQDEIVVQPKKT